MLQLNLEAAGGSVEGRGPDANARAVGITGVFAVKGRRLDANTRASCAASLSACAGRGPDAIARAVNAAGIFVFLPDVPLLAALLPQGGEAVGDFNRTVGFWGLPPDEPIEIETPIPRVSRLVRIKYQLDGPARAIREIW